MELKHRVGINIKKLRNMTGLSQTDYGKLFNKATGTMSDIEAGRCNVGINVIVDIANYHKISTDEILMK